MKGQHWWIAALVSWGIAFFEYIVQVPTNRYGSQELRFNGEFFEALCFVKITEPNDKKVT
jgi:uncharacterized protein (DUF486 family)